MKLFLNIIGGLALVLGIIGIVVPLLPTTPFLLLAAACFLRGSPRMHKLMMQSPIVGRYLLDYQEKKGLTLRVKIVAILAMWVSMGYSIAYIAPPPLRGPLTLIALAVTAYLVWGLKTVQTSRARGSPKDRNFH